MNPKKLHLFSLTLICLFCWSCNRSGALLDLIDGEWRAIDLVEEGTTLPLDSNVVSFSFDASLKSYTYSSPLNYREAGNFLIQSKYLITTDTLNQASREKTVEIIQLSEDSLILRMKDQNKERVLKLVPQS